MSVSWTAWGELLYTLFLSYFMVEVCFFCIWLKASFDAQVLTKPEPYQDRIKLHDLLMLYAKEDWRYFTGWFEKGKRVPYIYGNRYFGLDTLAEDFRTLSAWYLYGKHVKDMTKEEHKMIDNDLEFFKFKPGSQLGKCYTHTLYPVKAYYFPFIFYFVIYIIQQAFYKVLFYWGFERFTQGKLIYWKRFREAPVAESVRQSDPLILMHGLGIGLSQYAAMIHSLMKSNENLILLEFPWVSMQFPSSWRTPPLREEFLHDLRNMYKREQMTKARYCAHSYGTFMAAWVILGAKELISETILIDPCCTYIMVPVTSPRVLFSSLFPNTSHPLYIIFGIVIRLVSREIGIARTLCRHFWWYNVNVTPENTLPNTKIILHEGDEIIPVRLTKDKYHERRKDVEVLTIPTLTHAGFLYHYPAFEKVMQFINKVSTSGEFKVRKHTSI